MAKVAIIVPTREIDDYVLRCVWYCQRLPEEKEIIVVEDKIVPGFPAAKRNWAMQQTDADIFAFLDSDAYPSKGWLKNALYWLQCFDAVCGPGVLPPDASYGELVADQVHKWVFCPYRVTPQVPRIVSWFPSFNLIVKREVVGRFDNYLTGEDDKFGMNIKSGIFYHPDILVYHNRRGIFKPLWRQFSQWGKTKGHFQRLAFLGWVTTLWVYSVNFVKGFFMRKI